MIFQDYKWYSQSQLESYFIDFKRIYAYGKNISVLNYEATPFKRVGSHIIYVEKKLIIECISNGRYKSEIIKNTFSILARTKIINGVEYTPLIDHKTDQTREFLDYIIQNDIKTLIYVYSPDKMFWFFHDIWHWYLSDFCNNFYENVYGYPEMLVNIFAAIKQKQYGCFNQTLVETEVIKKCKLYKDIDKNYFRELLTSLNIENDF